VYIGHSPFFVLGMESDWLEPSGASSHAVTPSVTTAANAGTVLKSCRNICAPVGYFFSRSLSSASGADDARKSFRPSG
jgi:hypothetical protein